jgi:hypothetical protein
MASEHDDNLDIDTARNRTFDMSSSCKILHFNFSALTAEMLALDFLPREILVSCVHYVTQQIVYYSPSNGGADESIDL